MTPGACDETADGMSGAKIEEIIAAMRGERYRFAPVRRVYIPKKNGRLRPLGMPTWSGKLVGEVVRLLLEAYYDPQFSDSSHGFRRFRRRYGRRCCLRSSKGPMRLRSPRYGNTNRACRREAMRIRRRSAGSFCATPFRTWRSPLCSIAMS